MSVRLLEPLTVEDCCSSAESDPLAVPVERGGGGWCNEAAAALLEATAEGGGGFKPKIPLSAWLLLVPGVVTAFVVAIVLGDIFLCFLLFSMIVHTKGQQ